MQAAGYVLAGGASSRMGRNKALLTLDGRPLVQIAAEAVQEVLGNVSIIGPPETYQQFGFPVIPDLRAHVGPLGGIETALSHMAVSSGSDWSLILACDMPRVTAGTLRRILEEARAHPEAGCVLPQSDAGFVEPLCAAYHGRLLPAITDALTAGTRKVTDGLPGGLVHYIRITGDPVFQNINTPKDWRLALEQH